MLIGAMIGFSIFSLVGIGLAFLSGRRAEPNVDLRGLAYLLNTLGIALGWALLQDVIH